MAVQAELNLTGNNRQCPLALPGRHSTSRNPLSVAIVLAGQRGVLRCFGLPLPRKRRKVPRSTARIPSRKNRAMGCAPLCHSCIWP